MSPEVAEAPRKSVSAISIVVPILVSLGGLGSSLLLIELLRSKTLPFWIQSRYEVLNFSFTMQMMSLIASLGALAIMYFYDKDRFKLYFRWGTTKGNEWSFYGPALLVVFTLSTGMMMAMRMTSENTVINGTFFSLLPVVILLAATNAWTEEIYTRFVLVAGLHEKLSPLAICWISAIIFGAGHFRGTPGGPAGMLITGAVGWVYAKSVIDTRGFGWAWLIHFLGDAVIFGASAMVVAAQP